MVIRSPSGRDLMTGLAVRTSRSLGWRTSHLRFPHSLVAGTFAALAAIGMARPLHAQGNAVAGRVQVAGTNEPLAAAQITVAGGQQGAVSDEQGRFRLAGFSGTTVTLNVRRIGYRTTAVTARVGQTDLVVSLLGNPTSLEA